MADVLIIDDDTAAAAALSALLRREGHHVTCVPDAKQALTHLRQNEPELVLLDLDMPRIGGLELLDALRDDPRFTDLKIAVFSGHDEPDSVEAARRIGISDFIPKGGDWNSTYGRIKALLAEDAATA